MPRACGHNEVRIKVAWCGICGSDIHEYEFGPIFTPVAGGRNPHTGLELPVVMGHEYSGTVTEIGSSVTDIKVGQDVAVNPHVHDRIYGIEPCGACRKGKYNVCRRSAVCGLSSPGGGLSSEAVVRARSCIPLPPTVSLKEAAIAQPLTISWHAIRMSGFQKGQKALICGAGPIGLGILVLLRVWGASTVVVSEVTEARIRQAKKFGADLVVNPLEKKDGVNPVVAAVEGITSGEMVDVAFMAASHQTIYDAAVASTRIGGTILNCAIHEKPIQVNFTELTVHEKRILTGMRCTDEDWEGVFQAIGEGKIPDVEDMVTVDVPLSNAIEGAFLELINHTSDHVKILIHPDA